MSHLVWPIVVLSVLIGHFGINLAIYNRVNGFGLPRKVIKCIVKIFFVFTITAPPIVWWLYNDVVMDVLRGRPEEVPIPIPLSMYSALCLASWFFLGIPWLMWRPIFGLEWIRLDRKVDVVRVESHVGHPLALTNRCKFESKLPLNQLFDLSVEEIDLPVAGLPEAMDGYRIAHLSDLHLTGHVHPDFSAYAAQRATSWQPDLMALTGDIIDKQACIDWLPQIFSPCRARDGCYFVLGNHDTRIVDSRQTREAMDRAGWTDLGSRTLRKTLAGTSALLIGNEHPWFQRPALEPATDDTIRILLSHSPDQLTWARKHSVHLMLAGHTHGGQGRLPLAGPLLSPSFHGSRYASGDFWKPPTTMHVTRGLSGTHLLRINCRPELSLIKLRVRRDVDERT